MKEYASIDDLAALWRPLSSTEETRAAALIPIVCASLRAEASKVGINLDDKLMSDPDLVYVAKSVVVDVVARTLMTSTNSEPMSQMSESALGYSVSGTFLVPGGGLFIKRSELARLGITRQQLRGVEMYGHD